MTSHTRNSLDNEAADGGNVEMSPTHAEDGTQEIRRRSENMIPHYEDSDAITNHEKDTSRERQSTSVEETGNDGEINTVPMVPDLEAKQELQDEERRKSLKNLDMFITSQTRRSSIDKELLRRGSIPRGSVDEGLGRRGSVSKGNFDGRTETPGTELSENLQFVRAPKRDLSSKRRKSRSKRQSEGETDTN